MSLLNFLKILKARIILSFKIFKVFVSSPLIQSRVFHLKDSFDHLSLMVTRVLYSIEN